MNYSEMASTCLAASRHISSHHKVHNIITLYGTVYKCVCGMAGKSVNHTVGIFCACMLSV